MTVPERRHRRRLAAAALGACACLAPALTASATGDNLGSKLGTTQLQLNSTKSREKTLAGSIATLNSQVTSLASQISEVQARQTAARDRLTTEQDRVAVDRSAVAREHGRMVHLHHVLRRAQRALGAELRDQYERPQQSFISLVVDSGGFQQLLNGLQYLSRAKRQEQSIILRTRSARTRALAASARLLKLEQTDAQAVSVASTQNDALAGMSALLDSREGALAHEREAQTTALAASQEQGSKLEVAITSIQKQEAAARAAAQAVVHYQPSSSLTSTSPATTGTPSTNPATTGTPSTSPTNTTGGGGASDGGGGLDATGGWAIPYAVVLCESGGQNLPPNGSGASGYYQIEAATWKGAGGSGPAAYLAPKSEQDAIAAKLWNGGKGASNWACARIVGIT